MENKEAAKRVRPSIRVGCFIMTFPGLLAFLALLGFAPLMEVVWVLMTGWVNFLFRTVPKMSGNPSIAGMAALCSVLIVALGHAFLRWLTRSIPSENGPKTWRFRWTLCGFVSVLVLFLVGMAAGGIVHQLGWLVSSPEPMFESPFEGKARSQYSRQQQSMALGAFEVTLLDSNSDVELVRTAFHSAFRADRKLALFEKFQMFAIVGADDPTQCVGIITFPRARPPAGGWTGIIKIDDRAEEITTEGQLGKHLATFRDRLVPLMDVRPSAEVIE